MPKVKKNYNKPGGRIYADKKARKKHVESMFLTNKQKKHTYYFKNRNITKSVEQVKNNFFLKRYVFSLKVLESGYITIDPLKAIARLYKWFLKNQNIEEGLKLRLRVFPDFVLTSKPKEMRMGKGKGAPASKAAVIKAGAVLFTLENRGVSLYITNRLVRLLSQKVPFLHKIVLNVW